MEVTTMEVDRPEVKIVLLNYKGYYLSGAQIDGRIECYFDKNHLVKNLRVKLVCTEQNRIHRACCAESATRGVRSVFTEIRRYITPNKPQELPGGKICHDFAFKLGQDIPTTFFGPYGSITYKIQGLVDMQRRQDYGYENTIFIKVYSPIDVSMQPLRLLQPTTYTKNWGGLCSCITKSGVTLTVNLPKKIFIPGEPIKCQIDVTNRTPAEFPLFYMEFTKHIKYKASGCVSTEEGQSIISMRRPGVPAKGSANYDLEVVLPDNFIYPNFAGCQLYSVRYSLSVVLSIDSIEPYGILLVMDDVTVGHIPLQKK